MTNNLANVLLTGWLVGWLEVAHRHFTKPFVRGPLSLHQIARSGGWQGHSAAASSIERVSFPALLSSCSQKHAALAVPLPAIHNPSMIVQHTGDLASLDAQGYIRIHGRARDVIIRGGENIYPAEVEDCLFAHPDVYAAAEVAVPDDDWGQVVGAAVQLREGGTARAEELEAHVAARIAHFKVPRRWHFVESFPLTPSGKIRKVEMRERSISILGLQPPG